MKLIFALNSLLLLGLALCLGCQQAKQPETADPAFKSVAAVEHDNFLRYDTIPPESAPGAKQPGVQTPGVRILRLPDGFRAGDFRAGGRVTSAGEDQFIFTTEKQETLTFQLDAADQFSPKMKNLKDQPGALTLRYNSSAGEADEQLQLNLDGRLALAYLWQTAARPLALQDDGRPLLRQLPLAELPKGNALVDVPVQLLGDAGPVNVRPGESVPFKKGGKSYRVFVQTSMYLAQADEGEDGSSGYVLHATVVQDF